MLLDEKSARLLNLPILTVAQFRLHYINTYKEGISEAWIYKAAYKGRLDYIAAPVRIILTGKANGPFLDKKASPVRKASKGINKASKRTLRQIKEAGKPLISHNKPPHRTQANTAIKETMEGREAKQKAEKRHLKPQGRKRVKRTKYTRQYFTI
jgi:hypothetical protein